MPVASAFALFLQASSFNLKQSSSVAASIIGKLSFAMMTSAALLPFSMLSITAKRDLMLPTQAVPAVAAESSADASMNAAANSSKARSDNNSQMAVTSPIVCGAVRMNGVNATAVQ